MANQQDEFGATTPNTPSPTSQTSTSTPGGASSRKPASAAATAAASDSPAQPTASAEPQQDTQPTTSPEATLLDTALNSGKKWIEDSGVLNNVNQLPQSLKDLGNRAVARVNDLSTTQKVVGGAILAVGLGWLATRKGKSSPSSSPYNYGRQRDAGSYGRRSYGYQAPDASKSGKRSDSGAPYGNTGIQSGSRFGDSSSHSGASASVDHGAQSPKSSARSASSDFGSSSSE